MKKFGKMLTAAALAVSCMAITIPGYAAYSLSSPFYNDLNLIFPYYEDLLLLPMTFF